MSIDSKILALLNYKNWRLIATLCSGLGLLCVTGAFAAYSEAFAASAEARAMNLMIVALGTGAGWLAGILLSPAQNEKAQFHSYGKALGLFASGYAAGKADKLLDRLLDPFVVLRPLNAFRSIVFLVAFLVSMIVVFVFRTYAKESSATEASLT